MTEHSPSYAETRELLPCPFCGGEPQLVTGGPGNWYVRCLGCKCATDDTMSERAVSLWNTRAAGCSARPVMQAAENAAKVVEGWSDAKRAYADRVTGVARTSEVQTGVFPYQQTFDAIVAAVSLWPDRHDASGISISVRKFQEAFNNHRDSGAFDQSLGVAQQAPKPPSPDQYEFPYQRTFDAICAAVDTLRGSGGSYSVSVKAFQDKFNNHRDAESSPLAALALPSTEGK